jgi:hypothetical protein
MMEQEQPFLTGSSAAAAADDDDDDDDFVAAAKTESDEYLHMMLKNEIIALF